MGVGLVRRLRPYMAIIRAWDQFQDMASRMHDRGVMSWGGGPSKDKPITEGDELKPFESVGSVLCGSDEDGVAMSVGVPSFGTVKRLLVADGEEVKPGQPLLEFEERSPTMAEWEAEHERASRAELRADAIDRKLDSPVKAMWGSLRRRL